MEEKNQNRRTIPVTITKDDEEKNFPSVYSAAKFYDVNSATIFYAIKGKNKFKRRSDKTSFQVFKTSSPTKTNDDCKERAKSSWSFLKIPFPNSWRKRDKIDYYDIKTTTDPRMKLQKSLDFLNSRPESYFSQIRNIMDDDPFDCDPPGFSNA